MRQLSRKPITHLAHPRHRRDPPWLTQKRASGVIGMMMRSRRLLRGTLMGLEGWRAYYLGIDLPVSIVRMMSLVQADSWADWEKKAIDEVGH